MTDDQLQQFRNHVREALDKIPGVRVYALDETSLDSLALLGISWLEKRAESGEKFSVAEFRQLMAEVVASVPSLRQERPEEPSAIPQPWKDPVTGATPRNPFADPPDLESQGILTEREPQLATHLKRIAGGVSYAYLAELRDKEAARARLAAIIYGQQEHKTNPWVTRDLQAQAQLVREDPERASYFKREAEPVHLPWQPGAKNLTSLGQLTAKAPHIAKLANRAAELQRQIIAEQVASAKAAESSARTARQKAEALLQ